MDDALMVAFQAEEKRVGFAGMLRLLLFKPRVFFAKTVARDKFPFLAFSAWLVGLAHSLQWLDKFLLTPGSLISSRVSSFVFLMIMSFVFMGFFYLIGGTLFHFYAYLADTRKDIKNSMAVAVYAWMPFVLMVFLTKIVSLVLLGNNYLSPPASWWFQMPSLILIGLSVLYGWFLAIYAACTSLGCRKLRGFIMLFVVPILWFVFLGVFAKYMALI